MNTTNTSSQSPAAAAAQRSDTEWQELLEKGFSEPRFELFRQDIAPLYGSSNGSEFEVFLRLRDTEGEMVSPSEFFPAASRLGLAPQIDQWVTQEALRLIAGSTPTTVRTCSINVTSETVRSGKFPAFLAQEIDRYGTSANQLCFDLSESMVIDHLEETIKFAVAIHALGCRFALDDFGRGMGSFLCARQLPLSFIKIDGYLVQGLLHDRLSRAIVSAVSDIGQVLGVEVIAENVEDQATLGRLKSIGVEYVQGHIVGRPVPMLPAEDHSPCAELAQQHASLDSAAREQAAMG